jgi:hypothetical protein
MKGLSIVVILFCASLFLKREIINQKKNSPRCGEFNFKNKRNYSLKDALEPPDKNIADILLFCPVENIYIPLSSV